MSCAFAIAPVAAYLVAGGLKFLLNFLAVGRGAIGRIGLGGFPSTHTAIVTSGGFSVLLSDWKSPTAALAVAICLVVIIDAMDLRNRIGRIARTVNQLSMHAEGGDSVQLRERNGHTPLEVLGGAVVGFLVAITAVHVS